MSPLLSLPHQIEQQRAEAQRSVKIKLRSIAHMARIVLSNKTENAQLFAFFPFLPVVGNLESLESTESLLELQDREI